VIEDTLEILHNIVYNEYIRKHRKNGCVIIEGAPDENKMAGKGKITSERASSWKMIRFYDPNVLDSTSRTLPIPHARSHIFQGKPYGCDV
jgi:hypothetical protein